MGLIQSAMGQSEQGQPQPQPGASGGSPSGGAQKYRKLIEQLIQFVYSEQGVKMVAQAFKSGAPANEVVPLVVSRIFQGIMESAQQAGKRLPPDMMVLALVEVTQAVLELAESAGVIQSGESDQVGESAFYKAAGMLDKNVGNKMQPGDREEYGRLFAHLSGGAR